MNKLIFQDNISLFLLKRTESLPKFFYGRKGKLYQTYLDGIEELTALSLVTNAVIYWNTLYLEKVLAQMKQEGYDCSEELLGKLSPLLFEHITFVGKYTFQYNPVLKDGSLRPLHLQEIT